MLEYLKSVLGQQMATQQAETNKSDEVDDSTILEYASLFQELDDLTEKGTAIETAVRTPISIPLDDDIELDSIEINLTDGRVTDIPADATVQESVVDEFDNDDEVIDESAQEEMDERDLEKIEQQYAGMKTYMDFYNEATEYVIRLPRESDDRYAERVDSYISEAWNAYNAALYQEGVFGHSKIKVNDSSVPDKIHINFGKKNGSKDYNATIPIMWETDKDREITKKQLDSVQVWSKFGKKSLDRMTDEIYAKICSKYKVSENKNKWEVLTPKIVGVPANPADQYIIVIGFETDFSKNIEYWSFSIPVKSIKIDKSVEVPENEMGTVKTYKNIEETGMIRKRDFKLEMAVPVQTEYARPMRHSRFYQEAIDFGGGGAQAVGSDTGATPPPAPDANAGGGGDLGAAGGATPPDPNAGAGGGGDLGVADSDPNAAAGGDMNLNGAAGSDPNAAGNEPGQDQPAADAEPANVNDVSDQIANKVSQTTENQTSETQTDDTSDVDAAAEGTEGADDLDIDKPDEEAPDSEDIGDVDSEIESLGKDESSNEDSDDTSIGDETPDNLDDLTIDQLIAQGSEKLKGMTIGQLKDFINAPDGTTPEEVKEEDSASTEGDDLDSVNEYENIGLLDEKVMMENFFTDASNIRERIKVAIEDVVPGLTKIRDNCSNGKWDRYKLREFWRNVSLKDDSESLIEDTTRGKEFCSYISDLQHFLRVAKKRRAKDVFKPSELSAMNDCDIKLKQFSKICDTACKSFFIKNDVGMKDVAEDAELTLKKCEEIMDIVKSEEFAEYYIQEALFVTKRNVNNLMMSHVKSSLGILNTTEMTFPELIKAFKAESKRMNKILNKASRMKIYTPQEQIEIKKLNIKLMELSSYIRMNNLNDAYTNRVKTAIKEYVNQCKIVSDIIDKHVGGVEKHIVKEYAENVVQEGFEFFKSADNKDKPMEEIYDDFNKQFMANVEKLESGLREMKEHMDAEDWSKRDLVKYWTSVALTDATSKKSSEPKVKAKHTGENFSTKIASVKRVLQKTSDSKLRDAFTDKEIKKIEKFSNALSELNKTVIAAYGPSGSATFKDVSKKIDNVLDAIDDLKTIVGNKQFKEAFINLDKGEALSFFNEMFVVQEMGIASGCSAALNNVKNQLMNAASDEFDFSGGGYVPTIKLTSKQVPTVAVSIKENGRNIEIMPEINNVPDWSKMRKGISINGASQVILDFARELVKQYSNENKVQECGDNCTPANQNPQNAGPSAISEDDASGAPSGTDTLTANTTTGADDIKSGTALPYSSNQNMSDGGPDAVPSGTADTDTTSANDASTTTESYDELSLEQQFEEFMNSY